MSARPGGRNLSGPARAGHYGREGGPTEPDAKDEKAVRLKPDTPEEKRYDRSRPELRRVSCTKRSFSMAEAGQTKG
jgi:hypothetical protein